MNKLKPLVLILIVLLSMSGCKGDRPDINKNKPLPDSQPDEIVYSDSGKAARQGDWIYFINGDNYSRDEERVDTFRGALCRMKADGTNASVIIDLDVSVFNIENGNIYFVSYDNGDSYYCSIKIDGTQYKKILKIDNIYYGGCYDYINGIVYYTKDFKLYRMKNDGSSKKKITDFPIYNLRAGKQYAYFTQSVNDTIGSVYKVSHDGEDSQKITKSAAYVLNITDQYAYYYLIDNGFVYMYNHETGESTSITHGGYEEYLFVEDEGFSCVSYTQSDQSEEEQPKTGMYIIPYQDGTKQKISDDNASKMAYYKGYIYYVNESSTFELYRIKPDGTGRQLITDDYINEVEQLDIFDDWIYYFSENDEGRIYRVSVEDMTRKCIQIEDIGVVGG